MYASKNLDAARVAFEMGDVEASKKAHLANHKKEEKHKTGGDFIGSFIYGGLDGILTTFAIVGGVVGSNLGIHVIVIIGVSNVFADALAMAAGDYLSTKSEMEYNAAERQREEWEVENNPEGEKLEMEEIYVEKGLAQEDAKQMVEILCRNKKAWVDVMMVEELGIVAEDENPMKNALVTFGSFTVVGFLPLLPFILGYNSGSVMGLFWVSVFLTFGSLFGLGAVKTIVTGGNPYKAGAEILVIGGIAAIVAFVIGLALAPLALPPAPAMAMAPMTTM